MVTDTIVSFSRLLVATFGKARSSSWPTQRGRVRQRPNAPPQRLRGAAGGLIPRPPRGRGCSAPAGRQQAAAGARRERCQAAQRALGRGGRAPAAPPRCCCCCSRAASPPCPRQARACTPGRKTGGARQRPGRPAAAVQGKPTHPPPRERVARNLRHAAGRRLHAAIARRAARRPESRRRVAAVRQRRARNQRSTLLAARVRVVSPHPDRKQPASRRGAPRPARRGKSTRRRKKRKVACMCCTGKPVHAPPPALLRGGHAAAECRRSGRSGGGRQSRGIARDDARGRCSASLARPGRLRFALPAVWRPAALIWRAGHGGGQGGSAGAVRCAGAGAAALPEVERRDAARAALLQSLRRPRRLAAGRELLHLVRTARRACTRRR